ncbi:MAG TPA: O-antigen ligase family protein [Pyrinomonadaceae bacterium]
MNSRSYQTQHSSAESRPIIQWLERGIIACIFVIAGFAPISIAVTQAAWIVGVTLWIIRFAFSPRPHFHRTPIDYALLGFFVLSGISGVFSYNPVMSIGKMRAASLFTIVYLVAQNIKSLTLVRLLALTLIASGLVSVAAVVAQLTLGKGIKVSGVNPSSPLSQAVFRTRTINQHTPIIDGDTIWEVDGHRVNSPEELASALAFSRDFPTAQVRIYRVEWTPTLEVPRGKLLTGDTATQRLGVNTWSRGRDWRATGFFGHWVTYSEVLQLIASLASGLFLALSRKKSFVGLFLFVAIISFLFALGLSVTRASWLGFAISITVMVLLSASRRALVTLGLLVIPLVLVGLFVLQQKRSIGFFDRNDQSTSWRQTVWREGFHLLVNNPRHLIVGVGIDSIKGHWREWGLFDGGRVPVGHMHSNILQIALERGVPALFVWFLLLATCARMLWRIVKTTSGVKHSGTEELWVPRGVALGALGGLIGFFASGIVHYNWGDSEVVTVLYFMLGLSLVVERWTKNLYPANSV